MLPPILTKLIAGGTRRARYERRENRRLAPGQPTPCLIHGPAGEAPHTAWVHNLSVQGIGLLTAREFAPGTALRVVLVNAAHMFSLTAHLKVVRCYRIVSGDYFLGGQFARPLAPDEFMPFMM